MADFLDDVLPEVSVQKNNVSLAAVREDDISSQVDCTSGFSNMMVFVFERALFDFDCWFSVEPEHIYFENVIREQIQYLFNAFNVCPYSDVQTSIFMTEKRKDWWMTKYPAFDYSNVRIFPEELFLQSNLLTNGYSYFKGYDPDFSFITVKFTPKKNIFNLERMMNAAGKLFKNDSYVLMFAAENEKWTLISQIPVNFKAIAELSAFKTYKPNCEDKIFFLYKDIFYHHLKHLSPDTNIAFNRKMISDFKAKFNRHHPRGVKKDWTSSPNYIKKSRYSAL